ncbi:MAG: hypothetical protein OXI59_22165 [Gemmatimonadota bacterium]|nr:hypothetical protein [Gemmatimonadota bacterium]
MKSLEEKTEIYLATAAKILDAEGAAEAAAILRSSSIRVEQRGYDNWNGGTYEWTVFLEVDPDEFVRLSSGREALEEQIDKQLKHVVESSTNDWFGVRITPRMACTHEWNDQGP